MCTIYMETFRICEWIHFFKSFINISANISRLKLFLIFIKEYRIHTTISNAWLILLFHENEEMEFPSWYLKENERISSDLIHIDTFAIHPIPFFPIQFICFVDKSTKNSLGRVWIAKPVIILDRSHQNILEKHLPLKNYLAWNSRL